MTPLDEISTATRFLRLGSPFRLECGASLPEVTVAYRTWGRRADDGGNVVLVCHALTGSADVDQWWPGILGAGRALDPDRDFVVSSNVLGSCYGTTGPTTPGPDGRPWAGRFPPVTVRDMVRVQAALLDRLGVRRLRLVLGGSLGGLQALEWAASFPERVETVAVLAASARHSAWCIGLSEAQRQAIYADPRWAGGSYAADDPPAAGLAAARMMAMCMYRSYQGFAERFGREQREDGLHQVEAYLRHQGHKLVERFDAASYVALTRAMDTHDVGRGRGGWRRALRRIPHPALVVAIESDALYPPREQEELADLLPGGRLARLASPHGHDAFLIEVEAVNALLERFRAEAALRAEAAQDAGRSPCAC
jgi:homoserine O-acetyltransferase